MKKVFYVIASLVTMLALVFGLNYFGLVSFRFFAPKYENAKREVFENTQSFVEGKRQSLTKHYNEWRKSNDDAKSAIRMVVMQEFANFDTKQFTDTQLDWYNQMIK